MVEFARAMSPIVRVACVLLLLAASPAGSQPHSSSSARPATQAPARPDTLAAPGVRTVEPAQSTPRPQRVATIETSRGRITLRLFSDIAPKAVENFERLAQKGYYDGVTFHRVVDGFMIQGGDPSGTGFGGKSIWGAPFADEFSPTQRFDRPGLLAMANTGPGTNGSQFFITLKATLWLNDRHTIFGEVIEGMDVVQAIGKVQTDPKRDKPVADVVMTKVTVPAGPVR